MLASSPIKVLVAFVLQPNDAEWAAGHMSRILSRRPEALDDNSLRQACDLTDVRQTFLEEYWVIERGYDSAGAVTKYRAVDCSPITRMARVERLVRNSRRSNP